MVTRLTRDKLAQFLKSQELIKAFEQIDASVSVTIPVDVATAQATADAALELATAQTLGVFEPRQQVISVRAGDGIQVTPDAAGYVVTIDLGFLVNSIRAFLPHPQQIPDLRAGDGIEVVRDAAGNSVSINTGFLINAVRAFLPRQLPPGPDPDDAQVILAGRIFKG